MALPIAHGLIGASVAGLLAPQQTTAQNVKMVLICAVLANVPDFDYFFYQFLDWGESWHRSFSHSIVFSIVVGALTAVALGPFTYRSVAIFSLAILSHPVLDAVISEFPSGVQFFWPLSTRRIGFALIDYPNTFGRSRETYAVIVRFLKISFFELLFFSPLFVTSLWVGRQFRKIDEPVRKHFLSE